MDQPILELSKFESPSDFPEFQPAIDNWQIIRDEALQCGDAMLALQDGCSDPGGWKVLPLMIEAEDLHVVPIGLLERCRALAPQTVALIEKIPNVTSFAFSQVAPHSEIRSHVHENPFVSASLCLQGGGHSSIDVQGERHEFVDGQIEIFDYRRDHSVMNNGDIPRITLIVSLDKLVRPYSPK